MTGKIDIKDPALKAPCLHYRQRGLFHITCIDAEIQVGKDVVSFFQHLEEVGIDAVFSDLVIEFVKFIQMLLGSPAGIFHHGAVFMIKAQSLAWARSSSRAAWLRALSIIPTAPWQRLARHTMRSAALWRWR